MNKEQYMYEKVLKNNYSNLLNVHAEVERKYYKKLNHIILWLYISVTFVGACAVLYYELNLLYRMIIGVSLFFVCGLIVLWLSRKISIHKALNKKLLESNSYIALIQKYKSICSLSYTYNINLYTYLEDIFYPCIVSGDVIELMNILTPIYTTYSNKSPDNIHNYNFIDNYVGKVST